MLHTELCLASIAERLLLALAWKKQAARMGIACCGEGRMAGNCRQSLGAERLSPTPAAASLEGDPSSR